MFGIVTLIVLLWFAWFCLNSFNCVFGFVAFFGVDDLLFAWLWWLVCRLLARLRLIWCCWVLGDFVVYFVYYVGIVFALGVFVWILLSWVCCWCTVLLVCCLFVCCWFGFGDSCLAAVGLALDIALLFACLGLYVLIISCNWFAWLVGCLVAVILCLVVSLFVCLTFVG